jgi:hypothetical protein
MGAGQVPDPAEPLKIAVASAVVAAAAFVYSD